MLRQDEPLPSYCHVCARETSRTSLVKSEKYDENDPAPTRTMGILLRIFAGLLGYVLFLGRTKRPMEVRLKIPHCEGCSERAPAEPRHVDFFRFEMTFVVHKVFRSQVFQLRKRRASP